MTVETKSVFGLVIVGLLAVSAAIATTTTATSMLETPSR